MARSGPAPRDFSPVRLRFALPPSISDVEMVRHDSRGQLDRVVNVFPDSILGLEWQDLLGAPRAIESALVGCRRSFFLP